MVARFGGDEFTVLLRDVADEDDALRVAERLVDALRPPFVLDGEQRFLTASVGLTVDRRPATPSPTTCCATPTPRCTARRSSGKARCALFDDSLRERAVERLDLEGGLRHALDRGELRLLYQPEVDARDGPDRRRRGAAALGSTPSAA